MGNNEVYFKNIDLDWLRAVQSKLPSGCRHSGNQTAIAASYGSQASLGSISGEGDICPLPLNKGAGPLIGLLKPFCAGYFASTDVRASVLTRMAQHGELDPAVPPLLCNPHPVAPYSVAHALPNALKKHGRSGIYSPAVSCLLLCMLVCGAGLGSGP